VKVKIYIEGGGDDRSLHIKCREGFRKLFEKLKLERMPSTKACGGREAAFDDFKTALKKAPTDTYPILLVDSEAEVSGEVWEHLQNRDSWKKPQRAKDDQAQLMVQCMETWCVADRKALSQFFGQDLQVSVLPDLHDLESKDKSDVQDALSHATRNCGKDRAYKKGKKSFELLGQLNPTELEKLPHFKRLCDTLKSILGEQP